jgi:hypothetical protein
MKNIIKLSSLAVLLFVFGCSDDDTTERFSNDPSTGWIQFVGDETDAGSSSFSFEAAVPVNVSVPLNETDLTINYSLVAVSGLDVNTVFSQNSIVVPAGTSGTALVGGFPTINFDLSTVPNITEPMVFDVVLQSTSRSSVTVGIEGSGRPISNRVTLCPSYGSDSGLFLGDYAITSEDGQIPDLTGGAVSFGFETVTITEGSNGPLSRTFTALWIPQIMGGFPYTFDFDITSEGFIITGADISSPLACGGVGAAGSPGGVGISFGSSPVASGLTCGDAEFTLNGLELKYLGVDPDPEDPDVDDPSDLIGGGNCADDFDDLNIPVTIILTKI